MTTRLPASPKAHFRFRFTLPQTCPCACDRRSHTRAAPARRNWPDERLRGNAPPFRFPASDHAQDLAHARQRLEEIRLRARGHDHLQPLFRRFDLQLQEIQDRYFIHDSFPAVRGQLWQPRAESRSCFHAEKIGSRYLHVVPCQCCVKSDSSLECAAAPGRFEGALLTLIAQLTRWNPHFRQSSVTQQDRQSG